LQRSDDGSIHPAAPRVAAEQHIHPSPHAPAAVSKQGKGGPKPIDRADDNAAHEPAAFEGKPVQLVVEVPKDLRKQLRKKAERTGTTVDAVVVDALSRHLSHR
jgi:hypothetical protein